MNNNLVVNVRASSWNRLFDCAHAWEGTTLLGLRSVSGLRATLGTAIHASTALFDQRQLDGNPLSPIESAGAFIDALHRPAGDTDYTNETLTIRQAEQIGLELHGRYCREIAPQRQYVAVELTATPLEIDCGNGVTIRLTGTIDRVRQDSAGRGISDLKSGLHSVRHDIAKTTGHRSQLATYELLYEHTTGHNLTAPAEIIALSTGAKQAVAIAPLARCRELLLGAPRQAGLIHYAADLFRAGLFPPNPASQLCSEKYCARWATCHFHD